MIFAMPFNDGTEKVGKTVRENLLYNFLFDLQNEKVLLSS